MRQISTFSTSTPTIRHLPHSFSNPPHLPCHFSSFFAKKQHSFSLTSLPNGERRLWKGLVLRVVAESGIATANNLITSTDLSSKILDVYSLLKSQLLSDPSFDFTDESRQWLDQMLDYNVPKGKLNRFMRFIDCYKELNDGKELSDDEFFLACTLGWCVEWFQAAALINDDIVDNSHVRRGQPCWFRLPEVGMNAVNDAIIIRSQIDRILKMHFRDKPYYLDLLELFNEVEFQTYYGQMLDCMATKGENNLSKFSPELYHRIIEYKGAYYALYLPVACALLLTGEKLDNHQYVKEILIRISNAYLMKNDFLDCFGDHKLMGKDGTDIEEGKCSWLIVKALELANEEQKKVLYENYGKADPTCVEKIKELYENLNLPEIYAQTEKKIYQELELSVAMHPSKLLKAVWRRFVGGVVVAN